MRALRDNRQEPLLRGTAQFAAIAVLALVLGARLDASQLRHAPDAVAEMLARPDDLEPLVNELATVPEAEQDHANRLSRGSVKRGRHRHFTAG
jgi:hypothetical protein